MLVKEKHKVINTCTVWVFQSCVAGSTLLQQDWHSQKSAWLQCETSLIQSWSLTNTQGLKILVTQKWRHCLCPANNKTFVSYEKNIKWQPCLQQRMYLNSILNFISTFMLNTLPLNYSKVLFSGTLFSLFHIYLSLLLHRELTRHNSCKLCEISQNCINL